MEHQSGGRVSPSRWWRPIAIVVAATTAAIVGLLWFVPWERLEFADPSVADHNGTPPTAFNLNRGEHWTRGFTIRTFVDHVGSRRDYVLFVPYLKPDREKPPVLLFLNGFGENGTDGVMQFSQNIGLPIWEVKSRFPFVVVAPQCPEHKAWTFTDGEIDAAFELVDLIIKEYHADEDRIYLSGVSAGGTGTWDIASRHPTRFAAVVPLCGSGLKDLRQRAKAIAQAHLPVWCFYNGFDLQTNVVDFNRSMKRELLLAGGSPLVTEYPAPYHNCWDSAYRTPALFAWLLKQRRSRNAATSPFRLLGQNNDLNADFMRSGAVTEANDADRSIALSPAKDEAASLLTRRSLRDGEAGIECKAFDDDCEVVFRTNATAKGKIASGWKLIICPPDRGTGGVFSIDESLCICALDPLAQRAWRSQQWNDVRLSLDNARIRASINGLRAFDVEDARLNGMGSIGVLRSSGRRGEMLVRYIRIRESN